MGSIQCPLCCAACSIKREPITEGSFGPYTLHNFLPAGVLTFAPLSEDLVCDHFHNSDGWHTYPGRAKLSRPIGPEQDSFLRMLDFLVEHKFIATTCNLVLGYLKVRVYLIPYDLSNVQGKLRIRDETNVLIPARRYMRTLLRRVNRNLQDWNGGQASSSVVRPFLSQDIDDRTLAEIYSELPSPVCDPEHYSSAAGKYRELIQSIDSGNGVLDGMRSTLHQYQRRSVAAMIQRELSPSSIPDPLYIPIFGLNGKQFYLQPATMEILCERPMVSQTRGGILCEELGTGKTVMTLALVLATIDQLPVPEEAILDGRPVMTPLAFRHFPSSAFVDARNRISKGKAVVKSESDSTVPSLVEILIHYARVSPDGVGLRHHQEALEDLHLLKALNRNVPFYHHYENEPLETTPRARRKKLDPGPKVMYLTSATLIVVPPNLLYQWENEIRKHCEDTLRVLVVRDAKERLPTAPKLASNYDIVLMSHHRFSVVEAAKNDIEQLHSWKPCKCPDSSGTVRVPHCRSQCHTFPDVSPLLQIRWKRLVVDEGHISSSSTTNFTPFANRLSVERKWIVTGTPTTNLLGLSFGEGSELLYPEDDDDDDDEVDNDLSAKALEERQLRHVSVDNAGGTVGEAASSEARATNEDSPAVEPPRSRSDSQLPRTLPVEESANAPLVRRWNAEDRTDLHKLEKMLTHFLNVPQFAANSKSFANHVIAPLMDAAGPLPGAIQVLTQVMQASMIRHRIEDVEKDILLPIITQDTVLLDLDPFAVKTYNVMLASIAVNAIDSERVGPDYLFQPGNSALLQQAIENISQALFWHTDEGNMNVDELSNLAEKFRNKAKEKATPEDQQMLEQALFHVEAAKNDSLWRALLLHPNVFHRVYHMPRSIYRAWTVLELTHTNKAIDAHSPKYYHLLHPDRLTKLREMVVRQPLSDHPRIIKWGRAVDEEERRRYTFNLSRLKASKMARRSKQNDRVGDAGVRVKEMEAGAKAVTPDKLREMQRELDAAQKRVKALLDEREGGPADLPLGIHTPSVASGGPAIVGRNLPGGSLLASSPLADVRIGNSTSSKLNYILNEIRLYGATDKFLIFSRSPLTLAYVSEALELMQVKHLQFTSKISLAHREQSVTTFETSETFRVFLMELKHGARGLNLVTASRVIFCEPVWQADVETQAIKRVHRIGQSRPVSVKTLAIRNTSEEVMVARREALKRRFSSTGEKLPANVADDTPMRDFIANPKFLSETPPLPLVTLDFAYLGEKTSVKSPSTQSSSSLGIVRLPLPRGLLRSDSSASSNRPSPTSTGPSATGGAGPNHTTMNSGATGAEALVSALNGGLSANAKRSRNDIAVVSGGHESRSVSTRGSPAFVGEPPRKKKKTAVRFAD